MLRSPPRLSDNNDIAFMARKVKKQLVFLLLTS